MAVSASAPLDDPLGEHRHQLLAGDRVSHVLGCMSGHVAHMLR
jgi:hypothetical protein